MQKVFINQGIAVLPKILNDLRIKKIFLVIGKINYAFGSNNLKKVMNDICLMLNIDIKNFEKYWYNLMQESGLETKLSNLGVKKEDLELMIDSVNVERLKNHPLNIEKEILIQELHKIF